MSNKKFTIYPNQNNPYIVMPGGLTFSKTGDITMMYRLKNSNQKSAEWISVDAGRMGTALTAAAAQKADQLSRESGCEVLLTHMVIDCTVEVEMEGNQITRVRVVETQEFRIKHKCHVERCDVDTLVGNSLKSYPGFQIESFAGITATISSETFDVTVMSLRQATYEWEFDLGTQTGRFSHAEKFLEYCSEKVMREDVKLGGAYILRKDTSGYSSYELQKILAELQAKQPQPKKRLIL